ncbi:MAG: 50S ribosomal protein L22 [Oscillospiraceae bacterium]|nr:50S ribosomal protein L22 [Oscillospiraceae bacterium]
MENNIQQAKAHAKHIRISPRKVSIICDIIRGKDTKKAAAILKHTPKAGSEPLLKLLNSAVANAENNHNMDADNLYVSQVYANPGPILKRIMPRARGRAFRINKRTCHITVAVSEKA